MSPDENIAALDADLAEVGQTITLRRIVSGQNQDVDVCASVRPFKPEALVGGLTQTDSLVILSPTGIIDGWTDAANPQYPDQPWLPQGNDKALIDGRLRNITFVKPISQGDQIVRIELTVAG